MSGQALTSWRLVRDYTVHILITIVVALIAIQTASIRACLHVTIGIRNRSKSK